MIAFPPGKKWLKQGRIFSPGQYPWMLTHAQTPLPESLGGGKFRVHFACRDQFNRARPAFLVFDIEQPTKILELSPSPTIELGELGAFDDSGVMPHSLVDVEGSKYLYYTGWSKTVDVPFAFHIGLARKNNEGGSFERVSRAPVLGRNQFDPFITGAPCVLFENGLFKMWYVSATKWIKDSENEGKAKHYYTIKFATSADGIQWNCSNELCIDYRKGEYALARPVVWKQNGAYEMWFTFRGGENSYRIGLARSVDGKTWDRLEDNLNIEVSNEGWDSEMICYAYPIDFNGTLYALYNGNSYGSTGIGLAKCES